MTISLKSLTGDCGPNRTLSNRTGLAPKSPALARLVPYLTDFDHIRYKRQQDNAGGGQEDESLIGSVWQRNRALLGITLQLWKAGNRPTVPCERQAAPYALHHAYY